jgi:hypothetical protein
MSPGTLQDLVALIVGFALGGWLLGSAVIPERLGAATRLWLSLALGSSATVILAFPGLLAGQLAGPWFPIGLGLLAAVAALRASRSVWAGLRGGWSGSVARFRRRLRRPAMQRHLLVRLVTIATALAIGAIVVLGPQLAAADANGLLRGTTPWYYYRLVTDMISVNGIPATIGEWGELRGYPIEYLGTTLHTAITGIIAGGADLPFIEGYRLALAITALVAGYALWRRWLPAWWAWIATILTFSLLRVSTRLVGYRPETFGLVLALWSAWLFDEALTRRSLRWGALAGIVSAVAFHAHAEVWLISLPLWGGIFLSRLISLRSGARRPRTDLAAAPAATTDENAVEAPTTEPPRAMGDRPGIPAGVTSPSKRPSRRRWPRLAGAAMAAVVAFAGIAAVAAASGTGSRIIDITDKPGGTDLGAKYGDPTWAFFVEIVGLDPALDPPPDSFWHPVMQDPASIYPWTQLALVDPVELSLVLAALAILLLAAVRGDRRMQRLVITWSLFALGVFVGAFVLWSLYDTYVPARAGPRRILSFYAIALAGALAGALWLLLRSAIRLLQRRTGRSAAARRSVALGGHIVALVLGFVLASWLTPQQSALSEGRGLSQDGYQAMTWMRDNLPPGSVVMANTYTDGSVGAVTGLIGWLDGRAPYLEDPEWLDAAITRLRGARDFYFDPIFYGPPEGVDYVIAGRTEDLAGYFTWEPDEQSWEALNTYERLELVRSFRDDELVLWRVVPEGGG